MRLRNKKTGEIINGGFVVCEYKDGARFSVKDKPCFDSLDELKEEWEDYKPIEPLIKDPKIRKAVRAWAEANNDTKLYYHRPTNEMCVNDGKGYVIRSIKFKFEFRKSIDLESGWYSITELCGEEDE